MKVKTMNFLEDNTGRYLHDAAIEGKFKNKTAIKENNDNWGSVTSCALLHLSCSVVSDSLRPHGL